MKIIFLGTGEAFDETNPNNSILIEAGKIRMLLDCGFRVPYQLWQYDNNQSFVGWGIYQPLPCRPLLWFAGFAGKDAGRKKKEADNDYLPGGGEKIIRKVMDYAYKGSVAGFGFKLNFIEVKSNQSLKFLNLNLSFAQGKHFVKDLAIRINEGKKSICYSGDTTVTKEIKNLSIDSDLLIHEAYLLDKPNIYTKEYHASIVDLIKMAEDSGVKCLALTHINRNLRKAGFDAKSAKVKILVPAPFDELIF